MVTAPFSLATFRASTVSAVALVEVAMTRVLGPTVRGVAFTNSLLSGFDQVSYIGAFAAGDTWLDGWTNFDPQNTDY